MKEKQQRDLLFELETQDNQTENAIKEQEATAKIDRGKSGSDVNTGHQGGSGRKRGRPNEFHTDKWGNRPNENNWKKF